MVSYPIESLKTMRMYEFAYKNSLYVAVILNNVCLFDSATNINWVIKRPKQWVKLNSHFDCYVSSPGR